VTVAAAALVLVGVGTSQGNRSAPDAATRLAPPFEVPKIADMLPSTEDVSLSYGQPLTLFYQGPPAEELFYSPAPADWDLRRTAIREAWTQRWVAPDAFGSVLLSAIEYRSPKLQGLVLSAQCRPKTPWTIDGTDVAGLTGVGPGGAGACASIARGRVAFSAEVHVFGPDRVERARSALEAIVAETSPVVVDSSDEEPPPRWTASRTHLLRTWMAALLFLGQAAVLPVVLFDKMTWLRIHPRTWRRRIRRPTGDVEPACRAVRTQLRALAAARFATLVWTLRLTEELFWGTYKSLAAIVVVYLLGVLTQRLVVSRRLKHGRAVAHHTFGAIAFLVVGGALSLAVAGAAVFLLNLAASVGVFGSSARSPLTPVQAQQLMVVLEVFGIGVLAFAMGPLALFRRLSRRCLRDLLPPTGVAPILMLRAFSDDKVEIRTRGADGAGLLDQLLRRRRKTLEEIAAIALAPYGPLLAVGEPGQALPPGQGAIRLQYASDEWEEAVERMSEQAALISMTLARSEGLDWELRRLRDVGLLHKAVFIVPPVPLKEQEARLALLSVRLGIPWSLLDFAGTGRRVLAVSIPRGSHVPVVAVAASQDDVSYHLGIAHCVDALLLGESLGNEENQTDDEQARFSDAGRPLVEVVRPGQGRTYRGAWGFGAAWNVLLLMVLVASMAPRNPDTAVPAVGHDVRSSIVQGPIGINRLAGGDGDTYLFIQEEGTLASWNASTGETTRVATLTSEFVYLSAYHDGRVVINTREVSTGTSRLQAYDGTTGKPIWTAETGEVPPTLAVGGGDLWVPQPEAHAIEVRSMEDGSLRTTIELPCQPWSVSLANGSAIAACPRDRVIVRGLEVDSGAGQTQDTPGGVTQVLHWSGKEWWVMPAEMKLIPSDDPSTTLSMSIPFEGYMNQVGTEGERLAIVGYNRLSVFTGGLGPQGTVERVGTERVVRDLIVTPEGKVFFSTDSLVALLTPK